MAGQADEEPEEGEEVGRETRGTAWSRRRLASQSRVLMVEVVVMEVKAGED